MPTTIATMLDWFLKPLAPLQALAANTGGGRLQLMEPIGGCSTLAARPLLGTFFNYFNLLWPWMIGTAAGISVLMAIAGGLQVIMSGGDSGKRTEGIDRLKNAILGLMMLIFAGLLLRTLNPSFFVAGSAGSSGC